MIDIENIKEFLNNNASLINAGEFDQVLINTYNDSRYPEFFMSNDDFNELLKIFETSGIKIEKNLIYTIALKCLQDGLNIYSSINDDKTVYGFRHYYFMHYFGMDGDQIIQFIRSNLPIFGYTVDMRTGKIIKK